MKDWIDSLNKEQLENANLVAEAARKVGIPPHLAVSMAFAESRLKHYVETEQSPYGDVKTSNKGALGIMQLIPTTAAELQVDPKDRDQNILGGVTYLKKMLDLYQDPMLAAAAYNHGPSGAFFNGGELPKETKEYLSFIKKHGGFDEITQPPNVVGSEESWRASPATGYGNLSKEIIEGVSAATGAGISGMEFGARSAIKSAAQTAGEEMAKRLIESGRASSAFAVPEVASAAQGLIEGSGPIATSPAGGRATKNWAQAYNMADPEAFRARDTKEAHAMNRAAMAAEDKIKGLFGGGGGQFRLDPTRASLMLNQNIEPKALPTPSFLSAMAKKYPTAAAGAKRVLIGGLGGLGGAAGGMEALERGRQGDVVGSGLAGVGALGSLLAIPAATAAFGVPLAVGSGLALGGYDLFNAISSDMEKGKKWAEKNPPTQRELEEAKLAYFGKSR